MDKFIKKIITPISYTDFIKIVSLAAITTERYGKYSTSLEVSYYKSAPIQPYLEHFTSTSKGQLVTHQYRSLAETKETFFKEAKYVEVVITTNDPNDVFLWILSLDKQHKRRLSWHIQSRKDELPTRIFNFMKKKISWWFTIK